MGSYFKNYSSLIKTAIPYDSRKADSVTPLIGQVLEVEYDSPARVGEIIVKVLNVTDNLNEEEITTTAQPADKNIIQYPVPGELVLLSVSLTDAQINQHSTKTYIYTSILTSGDSISYNGNPFYMNKLPRSQTPGSQLQSSLYNVNFEKRFEEKFKNQESLIEGGLVKQRPILKPFEGDFVLQSRWGSTIRLGSSGFSDTNQWSNTKGISGDPIMIISSNSGAEEASVTENINEDDSIICLCSSQTIPVDLAVSRRLKSFEYTYNLPSATGFIVNNDGVDFIESKFIPPQMFEPVIGSGEDFNNISLPTLSGGTTDFLSIVQIVINNFEGGYYHPKMLDNNLHSKSYYKDEFLDLAGTPDYGRIKDSRYNTSGETMYGIDRDRGGSINTTEAGKKFWGYCDQLGAKRKWTWGYRGGDYEKQLVQLAAEVMSVHFNNLAKKYIKPKTLQLINSDPRLIIHMVYSSWNGPGWFKRFAEHLNRLVDSGVVDTNELTRQAIIRRTTEGYDPGSSPNSLIKQGGEKMLKLFQKMA